jgi:hypothetical protein
VRHTKIGQSSSVLCVLLSMVSIVVIQVLMDFRAAIKIT